MPFNKKKKKAAFYCKKNIHSLSEVLYTLHCWWLLPKKKSPDTAEQNIKFINRF